MAKTKTIKQGRKRGQGRKSIPEPEKKIGISISVYFKNKEVAILRQNSEKYLQLKESVTQAFREGIENILK